MFFLFNKLTSNKLECRRRGVWTTFDLNEAREVLAACRTYVNSLGLDPFTFVIIDIYGKEIE